MIKELIDRADRYNKVKYLPTPDEIRAACEEIQLEWSDEVRKSRVAYDACDEVSFERRMVGWSELGKRAGVESDSNN